MPDEFGGYEEEPAPEGPSVGERAQEVGGALASVVQKIGVGKIIAVLVIIAAVYVFLQLPKPITVRVEVLALDSDSALPAAELSVYYSDFFGSHSPAPVELEAGLYKVVVPSKTKVDFSAQASGFKGKSVSRQFESDGPLQISLARDSKVVFVSSPVSGSIGQSCLVSYSATVSNGGDAAESVELEGDGFDGAFSPLSGVVEVGPKAQATLVFTVSSAGKAEGDKVSGTVRIRGTGEGIAVDLSVGKEPRLEVPSGIDFSDADRKLFVELRNTGESDVSNIVVDKSEAILDKVRISEFKNGTVLKKDGKLNFVIEATGMTKDDKGLLYVGADCVPAQSVPVSYR